MKIIFVRHGNVPGLSDRERLTDIGIRQAKLLAKRLKREGIDKIYSSDLPRAEHTAEFISKELNLPVERRECLREYNDGIFFKDKKNWTAVHKKQYRELKSFLRGLDKNREKDVTILLVIHSVVNKLIISKFMKINYKKIYFFQQRHACVNILKWGEKDGNFGWKLILMGDTSYLPEKLVTITKKR